MATGISLKMEAIGVNSLVKLSSMVQKLESDVKFRFRDLNRQYKSTLMARYLTVLKQACYEKGMVMRPRGHKLIRENLRIATGGGGRGISAFQVFADGEASKFARIYDTGGVISPKASRYLAVPTVQLRGLSFNTRGKSPTEVLSLLQAQGIQTTTIPLNRNAISNDYQLGGVGIYEGTGGSSSYTGKLIIGKFKSYGPGDVSKGKLVKVSIKQVGLYILLHQVFVKPSYWLRDGTEKFVTEEAIPLLTAAAKAAADQALKAANL